jgi:23S rRNA-/tRNA-specific pseudouridylate synthase
LPSIPRTRTLLLQTTETAQSALAKLAPEDLVAIAEGRCFVDSRRITDENTMLEIGQSLTWHAPYRASASNSLRNPEILDEREGILAIDKPAEWSSEPDERGDRMSLSRFVLQNTRCTSAHIATRLDVGVSGLVLVATTEASRRHLSQLSEQGKLHRHYVALALGSLPEKGRWEGSVEERSRGKPREATTDFERLAQLPTTANFSGVPAGTPVTWVAFHPRTGRRHQLRIHAAREGHPLLGDRRYGGPKQVVLASGRVLALSRIYLHAYATEVPLSRNVSWCVRCPTDPEMERCWESLGGSHVDFPK